MKNSTIIALALVGAGFGSQNASADYLSYITGTSPVGWWA